MAKRKVNKAPLAVNDEIVRPLGELLPHIPHKEGVVNITINQGGKVNAKAIVEAVRKYVGPGILDTPPPYRQEWLDTYGLKVVYTKGRAVLQFKK